jgi:hypothetical protein
MPCDERKHHRWSIRLPDYDYTSAGACFGTTCVHGWECLLGEVVDAGMRLSEFGQVVSHYWQGIPDHVALVELDEWVVMPNHVHGMVVIAGKGEASPASAFSTDNLTTGGASLPDQEVGLDASPLLQSGSLGPPPGKPNR